MITSELELRPFARKEMSREAEDFRRYVVSELNSEFCRLQLFVRRA